MYVEYAKNPEWADEAQTVINLTVKFVGQNEELPFSATPNDTTKHGRDLFSRAIAGEFGVIGAFTPFVSSEENLKIDVRARRDQLLSVCDWTQLPDIPQFTKDLWAPYRQALRDITLQTGFPYQIDWPTPPN